MSDKTNIAIAGLGTVGKELVENIVKDHNSYINIIAVCARTKKNWLPDNIKFYDDATKMTQEANYDILIELIGNTEIANNIIKIAFSKNKHVVTANKALIANQGLELLKIAEDNNLQFAYEASVAACIPTIKISKNYLNHNQIYNIIGLLNGTTNYILTTMEKTQKNFSDILKIAQEKGYAESDPTLDIEAIDAAHKLAILSAICYKTKIDFDAVFTEGITNIKLADIEVANQLGYKIKNICISNKIQTSNTDKAITNPMSDEISNTVSISVTTDDTTSQTDDTTSQTNDTTSQTDDTTSETGEAVVDATATHNDTINSVESVIDDADIATNKTRQETRQADTIADEVDKIYMGVYPALIKQNTIIANIDHCTNLVCFNSNMCDNLIMIGQGAGGKPTASAVISDIIDIINNTAYQVFSIKLNQLKKSNYIKQNCKELGHNNVDRTNSTNNTNRTENNNQIDNGTNNDKFIHSEFLVRIASDNFDFDKLKQQNYYSHIKYENDDNLHYFTSKNIDCSKIADDIISSQDNITKSNINILPVVNL